MNRKLVFTCVIASLFLVATGFYFAFRFAWHWQVYMAATSKGVFLARYIADPNGGNGDFEASVELLKRDKPIDPAFLTEWRSPTQMEREHGIAAIHVGSLTAGVLTINQKGRFIWFDDAELKAINSAGRRQIVVPFSGDQ